MSPAEPSATLGAIKERAGFESACTAAPFGTRSCDDVVLLADALEKVLELHQPELIDGRNADGDEFTSRECAECDNGGVRDNWPCATILAVTAALAGEQPSKGR